MPSAHSGRHFIRMMRPILGLEGAPGIRGMRVIAEDNDAVIVEVEVLAKPDFDRVSVEQCRAGRPETKTRRYTVTVAEVEEGGER